MSQKQLSLNVTAAACAAFLVIGLASGFLTANYLNRNLETPSGTNPMVQGGSQPQAVTQNGMMQDVAQVIEKARANPDDFDAQMAAASMYAQIQRSDKALEFYQVAANIKGLGFDKTVALANALFDIREFDIARPLYLEALKLQPDNVDVRSDLGATFRDGSTPDFDSAIREFETVLKTNPKHEPTLFNLGATYLRMNDRVNAEKTLETLEQAAPGNELATRLRQALQNR